MEKKRSTTRAPQKEEDPSKTSSSIDTPEVEALQATLKQAKKDQLEQLQETLAITDATIDPIRDQIGSWFIEIHQTNGNTGAPWPGNLEQNRQTIIGVLKNAGYSAEPVIHDQIFAWK
jgi:hypothetical protein